MRNARLNWLVAAFVATCCYLGAILWMLGLNRIWEFVQKSELNAFGDFLAGTFAPLAFIWLVAAVFTQRQELTEARAQFSDTSRVTQAQLNMIAYQNTLAENAARANYKLAMFAMRHELYENILSVMPHHWGEKSKKDCVREAISLLRKSRFFFGCGTMKKLEEIEKQLVERRRLSVMLYVAERRARTTKDNQVRQNQAEKHSEFIAQLEKLDAWLYENFSAEAINDAIRPFLILPEDIGSAAEQQVTY